MIRVTPPDGRATGFTALFVVLLMLVLNAAVLAGAVAIVVLVLQALGVL